MNLLNDIITETNNNNNNILFDVFKQKLLSFVLKGKKIKVLASESNICRKYEATKKNNRGVIFYPIVGLALYNLKGCLAKNRLKRADGPRRCQKSMPALPAFCPHSFVAWARRPKSSMDALSFSLRLLYMFFTHCDE